MTAQLKLLLDAARWRLDNEYPDADYAAYNSATKLVESLRQALAAAQEFDVALLARPADFDPLASISN